MQFGEWLDQERGRASRVAERFGITLSAVSQWRTTGVPRDRIIDVHEFTRGDVTLQELVAPSANPRQAA